jgi:hypothetical protein
MYSDTYAPRDPNRTPIEQKGVCFCNKLDYLVNRKKSIKIVIIKRIMVKVREKHVLLDCILSFLLKLLLF